MSKKTQDDTLIILDEEQEVTSEANKEDFSNDNVDFELDFSDFSNTEIEDKNENKTEEMLETKNESNEEEVELIFETKEDTQENENTQEISDEAKITIVETNENNSFETWDILEPLTKAINSYKDIQKTIESKKTNLVKEKNEIEEQIKALETKKLGYNSAISKADEELSQVSINIASLDLMKGETKTKK